MLLRILIAVSIFCAGQAVFATALSEERSQCVSLELISVNHTEWKAGFPAFRNDRQLSDQQHYDLASRSRDRLGQRLQEIGDILGLEVIIPEPSFDPIADLHDLSLLIDDALEIAQEIRPSCSITH